MTPSILTDTKCPQTTQKLGLTVYDMFKPSDEINLCASTNLHLKITCFSGYQHVINWADGMLGSSDKSSLLWEHVEGVGPKIKRSGV